MKLTRYFLPLWFLMLSLVSNTQEITNVHFEQVGKQIHIYYDLQGKQEYHVRVFCSTDNGQTWGKPLQKVTGSVGEDQKRGKSKTITWDVLSEREKLSGEITFKVETISSSGYFTDKRDGKKYKWVRMGERIWMAENLNYKTYNSWWYKNSSAKGRVYGRLYSWDAALTACSDGWHLPTDEEWKTLEMYLGISQSEADQTGWHGGDEGKKLKSTNGWNLNGDGTNVTGFTARPGGYYTKFGSFDNLGKSGNWWLATAHSSTDAWFRRLYNSYDKVYRYYGSKGNGFSVRCVKN